MPEKKLTEKSLRWTQPDFDDAAWAKGKAPLGYGEPEIGKRKGTAINDKGQSVVFRKAFNVPADLLNAKGAVFRLSVASDNSAIVWINGQQADRDPVADHEFAYWNREVDLKSGLFRAGPNVIAVQVNNGPTSSDLYLDVDLSVVLPVAKKK